MIELQESLKLWPIWLHLGLRDVRRRFERSRIGIVWIFLQLITVLASIGLIYTHLLNTDPSQFIPYLTVGLVIWGYIVSAIVEGGNALVHSEGYIKQISLPLYIYIFRYFVNITCVSAVSLLVYPVIALIYHIKFTLGVLWVLPGMVLLCMTALLLTFISAHLTARYRDVSRLAGVLLQVLFYVTPVIYPAQTLMDRGLGVLVMLNPFYHLLEIMRTPLLKSLPAEPISYGVTLAIIVLLALFATLIARAYRREIVFYL
jgi:ABC-type polysaccharide/polyol phosphate export permease